MSIRPTEQAGATWLTWVILAAPWSYWILRMGDLWGFAPENYYGWAVPPMAAYAFALRWRESRADASPPSFATIVWAGALMGCAGVVLVTCAVLMEPNPLWTGVAWIMTLALSVVTLATLALFRGWRGLPSFLWPIGILWTALPWPATVQAVVVEGLRTWNASMAADLVSLAGYPAVVHGNLIELSRGWVGIEDACAGIRSLQTSVMCAVFLGELLRLRIARRAVLLGGSVSVVLVANLARTSVLAWLVARDGALSPEMHEIAGVIEMLTSLGAIVAVSLMLRSNDVVSRRDTLPERTSGRAALAGTVGVVCALGLAMAVPAWWYDSKGMAGPGAAGWRLHAPDGSWAKETVPAGVTEVLRCDRVEYLRRRNEELDEVAAHLIWSNDPVGRYYAGLHRPDICLPASGARLLEKLGWYDFAVCGRTVRFQQMVFDADGRRYQVFFAIWDDSRAESVRVEDSNAVDFGSERWRLVIEHRRRLVMEQLTFAIGNCQSPSVGRQRLAALLPAMLEPR